MKKATLIIVLFVGFIANISFAQEVTLTCLESFDKNEQVLGDRHIDEEVIINVNGGKRRIIPYVESEKIHSTPNIEISVGKIDLRDYSETGYWEDTKDENGCPTAIKHRFNPDYIEITKDTVICSKSFEENQKYGFNATDREPKTFKDAHVRATVYPWYIDTTYVIDGVQIDSIPKSLDGWEKEVEPGYTPVGCTHQKVVYTWTKQKPLRTVCIDNALDSKERFANALETQQFVIYRGDTVDYKYYRYVEVEEQHNIIFFLNGKEINLNKIGGYYLEMREGEGQCPIYVKHTSREYRLKRDNPNPEGPSSFENPVEQIVTEEAKKTSFPILIGLNEGYSFTRHFAVKNDKGTVFQSENDQGNVTELMIEKHFAGFSNNSETFVRFTGTFVENTERAYEDSPFTNGTNLDSKNFRFGGRLDAGAEVKFGNLKIQAFGAFSFQTNSKSDSDWFLDDQKLVGSLNPIHEDNFSYKNFIFNFGGGADISYPLFNNGRFEVCGFARNVTQLGQFGLMQNMIGLRACIGDQGGDLERAINPFAN